ncbi:MAG: hypothetical protein M3680_26705 [Myxococcota bacterium]|nr:hypothetical protein [Myxococcota bacterium]
MKRVAVLGVALVTLVTLVAACERIVELAPGDAFTDDVVHLEGEDGGGPDGTPDPLDAGGDGGILDGGVPDAGSLDAAAVSDGGAPGD